MSHLNLIEREISWQGEGKFQGELCLFLRFKRCNLKCPFCFGIVDGRRIPRLASADGKGNIKINEAKIGDIIYTFDDNQNLVKTEIINVLTREVTEYYEIKINGTMYYVTPEHPFFTTRGLVETKDLKIGDKIIHINKEELTRIRISDFMKQNNPIKNPKNIKKKVEIIFENFCHKNNINIEYVGGDNNKLIIDKYIPDFMIPNTKKLIELYDSTKPYYTSHGFKFRDKEWEKERINLFKKYGYECICIDMHKFDERKDDILFQLKQFYHNGYIVESIRKINTIVNKKKPLKVYNISCSPYNTYLIDNMWVHNCDTMVRMKTLNEKAYTYEELWHDKERANKAILITGGEPTLYNKDIVEFIEYIKDKDITEDSYTKLNFESNGHKLPELDEMIRKLDWKDYNKVYYDFSPKNYHNKNARKFMMDVIEKMYHLDPHFYLKFVGYDYKDNYKYLRLTLSEIRNKYPDLCIYVMPEGTIAPEIQFNTHDILQIAKDYNCHFSSRLHIIHNFY